MMLDTDMCLAYDNNIAYTTCIRTSKNRRGCDSLISQSKHLKASEAQCCAWVKSSFLINEGVITRGIQNEFCGITSTTGAGDRRECCSSRSEDLRQDCDEVNGPNGPAIEAITAFSKDEEAWLEMYLQAWNMATENGYSDLEMLSGLPEEEQEIAQETEATEPVEEPEVIPFDCSTISTKRDC